MTVYITSRANNNNKLSLSCAEHLCRRAGDDAAGHGVSDGLQHGRDVDGAHLDGSRRRRRRDADRPVVRQAQRAAAASRLLHRHGRLRRTGTDLADTAHFPDPGRYRQRVRRLHRSRLGVDHFPVISDFGVRIVR